MNENTRPRLLRHVVSPNSGNPFYSATLPTMSNSDNRTGSGTFKEIPTSFNNMSSSAPPPSNINMAFEDRTSSDSLPSRDIPRHLTVSQCSNNHYRTASSPHRASDKTYDQVLFEILKVDPESFAKQITLIELDYFKAIDKEEFTSFKWNGREKHKYAPNIVASTKWFNQINFWVQREILNMHIVAKRAEVLAHFIKIAKKLIELNNLYSTMAIISALQVECIYRLKQTWAALSNKDRATFRRLDDLFNQSDNYKKLREHTDSMRLPCIPYLGLYLSDLTYINVAHPSQGELEPQIRQDKINNILRVIASFQESEYAFPRIEYIFRYLKTQNYIEELQKFLEDDNYKSSKILEPDEAPCCPLSMNNNSTKSLIEQTKLASAALAAEGKWSPPKWGDFTLTTKTMPSDATKRSSLERTRPAGGPGIGAAIASPAGLPEPLLKVTMPPKFSMTSLSTPLSYITAQRTSSFGSLNCSSSHSTGMTSGILSLSQTSPSPYLTVQGETASRMATSVESGQNKPSASRCRTTMVTRMDSLCGSNHEPNRFAPSTLKGNDSEECVFKINLLDDSLIETPTPESGNSYLTVGSSKNKESRGCRQRSSESSDLNLVAVVAAAAIADPTLNCQGHSGAVLDEVFRNETDPLPATTTAPTDTDCRTLQRHHTLGSASSYNQANQTDHSSTGGSPPPHPSFVSPASSSNSCSSYLDGPIGDASGIRLLCHGCLQRKTIARSGVKTRFPLWHRFWLVLMESQGNAFIVYFEPNSFRATKREEFRTKQCQVQPLRGLRTLPKSVETSVNPVVGQETRITSFKLIDPQMGKTYKFRSLPVAPSTSVHPNPTCSPGHSSCHTSSSTPQCCFSAHDWFHWITCAINRLNQEQTDKDLIQLDST